MSGPVLDLGVVPVNRTDKNLCLLKLMEKGRGETNKKRNK